MTIPLKTLMSSQILSPPHALQNYTLETVPYDIQVDNMLLQDQPKKTKRPLKYRLRSLTKAQKRYDESQQEYLAIDWSWVSERPYLKKSKRATPADPDSLRRIINLTVASRWLAWWRLRLLKFDFDVFHRGCIKHQPAKALSRLPKDGKIRAQPEDDFSVVFVNNINDNEWTFPYCMSENITSTLMHVKFKPTEVKLTIRTKSINAQCEDSFYH